MEQSPAIITLLINCEEKNGFCIANRMNNTRKSFLENSLGRRTRVISLQEGYQTKILSVEEIAAASTRFWLESAGGPSYSSTEGYLPSESTWPTVSVRRYPGAPIDPEQILINERFAGRA